MKNPKGDLIEYCRTMRLRSPKFETRGTGSDHEPLFITDIIVDGEVKATGQGTSKRDSERMASELALESLVAQNGPLPQRERTPTPAGNPARQKSGNSSSSSEAYPIYAEVLVASLNIANSRVDSNRRGPESIDLVRKMTLDLYKGLLEELGTASDTVGSDLNGVTLEELESGRA
jgi:ribonuclease III